MRELSDRHVRSIVSRVILEPTAGFTSLLVGIALAGFLVLPQVPRGDDAVRVVMLRQIADGTKPVTKFSLIQPAVSSPLYWVLEHLHFGVYAVTLIPMIWLVMWCVAMWNVLIVHRSSTFAHHTIVLTVVSLLGAYLVGFGSDVFTALGMTAGVVCGTLAKHLRWRVVAWVVFVVSAANTPVMFLAAAGIGMSLALGQRRLRFLLLPVGVFAFMVVESTIVSGSLSWTRYTNEVEHGNVQLLPWGDVSGFGWPLWSGVIATLFSFGRGLFFYIPQLWNGPMRGSDRLVLVNRSLWCAVVLLVPLYGTWWAWYGGVSFGPRFFMLAVVPAAMAAAAVVSDPTFSPVRQAVCFTATAWSLWVAVAGAVFNVTTTAFNKCVAGGGFQNEALCLYTPEYSGLWAPLWASDPVGVRDGVFVVALVLVVAPTLLALAVSLEPAARHRLRNATEHLRGDWSV